jgi:hypothetical protein
MTPKRAGECTKCDKLVFDIVAEVDGNRRTGRAHDDAMRLSFLLMRGSRMDLTFCKACADGLTPADFPHIWKRVMFSWIDQTGPDHPNVKEQKDNNIIGLLGSKTWKELGYA